MLLFAHFCLCFSRKRYTKSLIDVVFRFIYFVVLCVLVFCLHLCVYHILPDVTGDHKSALDPLGLELQIVGSCQVCAGN